MKKTINTLLAITVVAVAMVSCGNKAKDMVAKKWQLNEIKSDDFDKQMADLKVQADTTKDSAMKAMLQQNLEAYPKMMEEMKKSTFEYKADGNYEASMSAMGKSMTMKGTWKLSEDGKKLISTDDKQKSDTATIETLTAEKLVIVSNQGGSKATITLVAAK